ncbi:MAG: response regulator [Pseudobacteriovorax sp.]|nr:response regulator [Pseudobacteriovorax sp.]
MLIDDEKIDQRIYKNIIDRSKVVRRLVQFLSPLEALEFLVNEDCSRVEAIFLDINMPKMNGFEFLEEAQKRLGENFTQTVVIMLTTSFSPKDRETADSFYVVKKYINKPLTEKHLIEVAAIVQREKGH